MEIYIHRLNTTAVLDELAQDATANGQRMVSRLIQEWTDGTNRFDRVGEMAYYAEVDGRVCGVCGLNQDPFAGDGTIGRVHRLYVHSHRRRQGVGSAIMRRVVQDASPHFGSVPSDL